MRTVATSGRGPTGDQGTTSDQGALSNSRSRAEITQDMQDLQKREAELANQFRTVHDARNKAQSELSRLDEQLRYREREYDDLQGSLPEEEEARVDALARLDADLSDQKKATDEALQLVQSYRDQAPDGALSARLEAELTEARAAWEDHQRAVQSLKQDIAALGATLEHFGDNGGPHVVSRHEAGFNKIDARVKSFEADVAALRLLSFELERSMTEIRQSYLEPVVRRMAPYFDTLFPGVRFDLSDRFAIENIERNGRREELGKLSKGTQEQISVLARLGFGRLLADQGAALPLILDDALIYSDDTRMEKMFEVLGQASGHHQVIMLTCRAASFAGLGGQRLKIEAGDF